MTATKAMLHIGKHKTGTTSFQNYVFDHREEMQKHGVLFVPMHISNFISACIIRDQLQIPPLKSIIKSGDIPSIEEAHIKLENFVCGKDFTTLLISCEHFSYFRKQTEIDALKTFLLKAAQIKPSDTSVSLVLREPGEFLKSYTNQIIKTGHGKSRTKTSPYYCEKDSWLLDDAAIKELWDSNFPQLDVIHYENGNTVMQLCKAMHLPINDKIDGYFANKTERGIIKRIKHILPRPMLKSAVFIKRKIMFRT